MKIKKAVEYKIKGFSDDELKLSQDIFGLVPQSVYFNFAVDLDIDLDKHKLIYVYGLSGTGKTIFKDELKTQLLNTHYVIDYDDVVIDKDKKMFELFNFNKDKEFAIRLFSTFGLFEMKNIFSRFYELSAGQQKRIQYMLMLYEAHRNEDIDKSNCVVLIDELATFLDSLSARVYMTGLRKFMQVTMPNTILFGFGCNDQIVGYWEDLVIQLVNGKIYGVTEITDENRETKI